MRIPIWFFKPEDKTPAEGKPILVYQEASKEVNRFAVGYYKDGEYHTSTGEALIAKNRILGWAHLLEPNMEHDKTLKEATTRREMKELREGDVFFVNGVRHVASTDSHLSGDASCQEYIVYDEEDEGWFETDFPEEVV